MAKLLKRCKQCNKAVEEINKSESLGLEFVDFSCGHSEIRSANQSQAEDIRDELWRLEFPSTCWNCKTAQDVSKVNPMCWCCKVAFDFSLPFYGNEFKRIMLRCFKKYQQTCIEFIEKSGFRCIIADEQGLGKTIEILGAIRYNKEKLLPVLFVVKSGLRYNWVAEIITWLSANPKKPLPEDIPYIISDKVGAILPGFNYYITSMAILSSIQKQILEEIQPNLIVIDESQHFKGPKSKKTKAVQTLVPACDHIVCLSGTYVMNRGEEAYVPLNLIKPEHWTSRNSFQLNWLEPTYNEKGYQNGFGGIKKQRIEEFKERTAGYIIRRLKTEVLKDLPDLQRNFKIIDVSDSEYAKAYNRESKLLEIYLYSQEFKRSSQIERYSSMMAYLTKMRELAGVMKAPIVAEEIIEFLESTEEKICVGISFPTIVGYVTRTALADWNPIFLTGKDSAEAKKKKEDAFRNGSQRLMISSILAGGEGLNLQFCSNAVIMELEWNIMRERQYEGRFHRFGQTKGVNIDYYIAKKTIDEYMSELRHKKKQWTDTAMQIDPVGSDEKEVSVGYMELAEAVAGKTI